MTSPLDTLRTPLEICSFCPKLCRFACPVAEVEHRETVTPWGLMTHADDLRRSGQTPSAESAELWSHCTGCDRCRSICKHENPVAETIQSLRAMTEAPHPVRLWARSDALQPTEWGALPISGSTRLMVGRADSKRCRATLHALSVLGVTDFGRTRLATSGHRLHTVGLMEEYAAHRSEMLSDLDGVDTVLCLDAEDVIALRREVDGACAVHHVVEYVSEKGVEPARVFFGDVLYLDACRGGRGLGLYDAPRAILAAMVTGQIIEGLMDRTEGGCCGAGAGYAALEPERAQEMAQDWAAVALDVPVVIMGECVSHLREALAPRPVWSWIEALAAGLKKEENP